MLRLLRQINIYQKLPNFECYKTAAKKVLSENVVPIRKNPKFESQHRKLRLICHLSIVKLFCCLKRLKINEKRAREKV